MGTGGHWLDEDKLMWIICHDLCVPQIWHIQIGMCVGRMAFIPQVESQSLVGCVPRSSDAVVPACGSQSRFPRYLMVVLICHPSVFVLFVRFCLWSQRESDPALLLWPGKQPAPAVCWPAAKTFEEQKQSPQTGSGQIESWLNQMVQWDCISGYNKRSKWWRSCCDIKVKL